MGGNGDRGADRPLGRDSPGGRAGQERLAAHTPEPVPTEPLRRGLLTSSGILGVQRSAGNAAVVQLLSGKAAVGGSGRPVVQRAYWEKAGNEYTWHGGDEQPPEGYVKLKEAQRPNPNNKKKLYDVYGPAPVGNKKSKKKGSGAVTPPPVAVGGAKKPLTKSEAATRAKGAAALLESAETQALESATHMQKAATPELAGAAAKAAEAASTSAKAAAVKLGELVNAVAAFPDVAAEVRAQEAAAVSAAAAAVKFSAQAARLAEVVEARAKVASLAKGSQDERAKLDAARQLAGELTEEADYLRTYVATMSRDLAAVGAGGGFVPAVDPAPLQAQLLIDIADVEQARRDTADEIEELVASVAAIGEEHELAADAVPLKELAVTTAGTDVAESRADIEARRSLRAMAGGEVNLSTLLTLPRFAGSMAAIRPYLEALKPSGLKPAAALGLLTMLSATRSEAELAVMAGAIAGGADLQVTAALATVDPKVSASDVALYAAVQRSAACKASVVLDLLPARNVALYATQPVLTELAELAKDGVSASRMAEVIVAEPSLPVADLAELTKLFVRYPAKTDVLLLAKLVKEGMKAGRRAADVTALVDEMESEGADTPAAATVKVVLQSPQLAGFTIPQVSAFLIALPGLDGGQIVEVSTWLNPMPAADKLELITDVFVADATPAAAIHATFKAMRSAGLDGSAIRNRVMYLRGFITAPGGDADASITEVGGSKILTGPEIHAHAVSVLTGPRPQDKVSHLAKYPDGQDPRTRSIDNLWLDANPAVRNAETPEEAVRRQKLAVAELCGKPDVIPAIVQQILAHQHGAAPRPIGLPSAEDALDPTGAAHTNSMHTIGGGGTINTPYKLAARACYSPTSEGKASAFKSPASGKAAVQAALNDYVGANPANWPWLRSQLTKGNPVAIDRPVAANHLVSLKTTGGGGPNGLYDRNGVGSFENQQAKPKYDGGKGGRKYFPNDNGVIWAREGYVIRQNKPTAAFETFGGGPDNRIPVEPTTLTVFAPITGVHLRIIGMDTKGGFVINSAYAYQ
ncbi:hypothetical protein K6U06_17740 [Acidiferrimicrobium sp. IK]|uniref:hypothetical protein n=1 Tax=Acidiferrimicrobium sp. IK TaxID=2871700 RepID=UPI0021CAEEC6|nr:hypothetical protein [Acidiferrimicrobium sp. IK]MCU4186213.1 hypothetical protein [Acidiferrimicrobium sp. IK]